MLRDSVRFALFTLAPIAACSGAVARSAADSGADGGGDAGAEVGTTAEAGMADACDTACPGFGCVGSVSWPSPTFPTYTFALDLADPLTGHAVAGATVQVCPDDACSSPLATYSVGSTGSVTVTGPSAASGLAAHLAISGMAIAPTLEFVAFPDPAAALGSPGATVRADVVTVPELVAFAEEVGVTIDSTTGVLAFVAHDCADDPAAGVRVAVSTADAGTTTIYAVNGVLSTTATETGTTGAGYVVNVPVGPAVVSARTSAGTTIGSQPLFFAAGTVTTTHLVPTP
jgi:hypothetical protein